MTTLLSLGWNCRVDAVCPWTHRDTSHHARSYRANQSRKSCFGRKCRMWKHPSWCVWWILIIKYNVLDFFSFCLCAAFPVTHQRYTSASASFTSAIKIIKSISLSVWNYDGQNAGEQNVLHFVWYQPLDLLLFFSFFLPKIIFGVTVMLDKRVTFYLCSTNAAWPGRD